MKTAITSTAAFMTCRNETSMTSNDYLLKRINFDRLFLMPGTVGDALARRIKEGGRKEGA